MGRNSMRLAASGGGKGEIWTRTTALHNRLRPLNISLDEFETAFVAAASLLEIYRQRGLEIEIKRRKVAALPEIELYIGDGDDFYRLIGMHTMGFYWCRRGDAATYKMTERNPVTIARKIRKYFGLN